MDKSKPRTLQKVCGGGGGGWVVGGGWLVDSDFSVNLELQAEQYFIAK